MDTSTLNDYAGIAGFFLSLVVSLAGAVAFLIERTSRKAGDNEEARLRKEENEKFERQLNQARLAHEAHISALGVQNEHLRQGNKLREEQFTLMLPEVLVISLAKLQLRPNEKEVLVVDIENKSQKTVEVLDIQLCGTNGRSVPCWTVIENAPETNSLGMPEGMAISKPWAFRLHKNQTARAFFAVRQPGPHGDLVSGTLVAPDYFDANHDLRLVMHEAENVVITTLYSSFRCENATIKVLDEMKKLMLIYYDEGVALRKKLGLSTRAK